MNIKITLLLSLLVFTAPLCVCASSRNTNIAAELVSQSPPQSDTQKIRNRDFQLAPLRNNQDIKRYIAQQPIDSPLSVLSRDSAKRFAESVQFNDRGVTTFSYKELSGLKVSQVYAILSLLGIQDATAAIPGLHVESDADRAIISAGSMRIQPAASTNPEVDYGDYRCVAHGTCQRSLDFICTGNC